MKITIAKIKASCCPTILQGPCFEGGRNIEETQWAEKLDNGDIPDVLVMTMSWYLGLLGTIKQKF